VEGFGIRGWVLGERVNGRGEKWRVGETMGETKRLRDGETEGLRDRETKNLRD